MVIDGDGQFFLRAVLPDYVAVEKLLDLRRPGQAFGRARSLLAFFVVQNRLADADTFVADIRARIVRRRADQFFNLFLGLMAKGTAEGLLWVEFFYLCAGPPLAPHH